MTVCLSHTGHRTAAEVLARGHAAVTAFCAQLRSLVAHRRGADITASDHHPLAGAFMAHNASLNALPPLPYRHGDWAATQHLHALGSLEDQTLVNGRYDLIIGADLLYDRDQPQALSQFIHRHSGNDVEVVIGDPDRSNHASFSRKMGVLGYSHTEAKVHQLPDGASYKGRLHSYLRQTSGDA